MRPDEQNFRMSIGRLVSIYRLRVDTVARRNRFADGCLAVFVRKFKITEKLHFMLWKRYSYTVIVLQMFDESKK